MVEKHCTRTSSLKCHQRLHSEEEATEMLEFWSLKFAVVKCICWYSCQCGNTSKQAGSLKRHLIVHGREGPHKCAWPLICLQYVKAFSLAFSYANTYYVGKHLQGHQLCVCVCVCVFVCVWKRRLERSLMKVPSVGETHTHSDRVGTTSTTL